MDEDDLLRAVDRYLNSLPPDPPDPPARGGKSASSGQPPARRRWPGQRRKSRVRLHPHLRRAHPQGARRRSS
jgi:hypothetical protein